MLNWAGLSATVGNLGSRRNGVASFAISCRYSSPVVTGQAILQEGLRENKKKNVEWRLERMIVFSSCWCLVELKYLYRTMRLCVYVNRRLHNSASTTLYINQMHVVCLELINRQIKTSCARVLHLYGSIYHEHKQVRADGAVMVRGPDQSVLLLHGTNINFDTLLVSFFSQVAIDYTHHHCLFEL